MLWASNKILLLLKLRYWHCCMIFLWIHNNYYYLIYSEKSRDWIFCKLSFLSWWLVFWYVMVFIIFPTVPLPAGKRIIIDQRNVKRYGEVKYVPELILKLPLEPQMLKVYTPSINLQWCTCNKRIKQSMIMWPDYTCMYIFI